MGARTRKAMEELERLIIEQSGNDFFKAYL